MFINDELLELIDNNDLDKSEALLFAFAVTYDSQFNTLNSLISSGIIALKIFRGSDNEFCTILNLFD